MCSGRFEETHGNPSFLSAVPVLNSPPRRCGEDAGKIDGVGVA